MTSSRKRDFIFIYNAKGGKWNGTLDLIHKYLSPATYKCNLCKITFDIVMKKKWKDFIKSSSHNFIFLHKEDLIKNNMENYQNQLPLCIEKKNGEYDVVISAIKMKTLRNEDDLILLFQKIL